MLEICLKLVGCKSKKGLSSSSSCYLEGEYPQGPGLGRAPVGHNPITSPPSRTRVLSLDCKLGPGLGGMFGTGQVQARLSHAGVKNRAVSAACGPRCLSLMQLQRERGSTIYGCKMSSDLIAEPINKSLSSGLSLIFFFPGGGGNLPYFGREKTQLHTQEENFDESIGKIFSACVNT